MYCTADDLRANIGGLTSANTKAPTAFLEDVADRKSQHIDSVISNRYETPVVEADSPKAFAILKDICIELCRPVISKKLSVATSGVSQTPVTGLEDEAKTRLEQIRDGYYQLLDAEKCEEDACMLFDAGQYDLDKLDSIPYTLQNES